MSSTDDIPDLDAPNRVSPSGDGPVAHVGGPSRVIVRLDRIGANLRAVRERVGPQRAILLPVKANAYGHGAVEVSRYVIEHGLADWLGVATVTEGEELRVAGIAARILKLSPCLPGEWDRVFAAKVTPAIESADEADRAEQAAARRHERRAVPVHLKIDTGMRRVGVDTSRGQALAAHLAENCPSLRVEGVFTHLAVSDSADPADVEFTGLQLQRFQRAVADVSEALGYLPDLVHAANSGGVLAHSDSWGNMVRPGIMAYGYYPDAATPRTARITPALEWRAPLLYVKRVAAGESVSYGRTWTAPRDTVIGTVPVGYADGYRRALSNTARVLRGEHVHPVVGRVCMDQLLVDLGPDSDAAPGDEVVLLGGGDSAYTADEMAADLGTIPYEILTLIGGRVRREYRDRP